MALNKLEVSYEVIKRIRKLLEKELVDCNYKISKNKRDFRKLEQEQTILKRERVKLTELINDMNLTGEVL